METRVGQQHQATQKQDTVDTSPAQVSVLARNFTAQDSREEVDILLRLFVYDLKTGTPELYQRAEAHFIFFNENFR